MLVFLAVAISGDLVLAGSLTADQSMPRTHLALARNPTTIKTPRIARVAKHPIAKALSCHVSPGRGGSGSKGFATHKDACSSPQKTPVHSYSVAFAFGARPRPHRPKRCRSCTTGIDRSYAYLSASEACLAGLEILGFDVEFGA